MHDTLDDRPPTRRLRFRFSLLALFLFVTLLCVLLAWAVQPQQYVVEALFRVAAQEQTVLGEPKTFDAREYEIFRKTQVALIKSGFVLMAALRDPKVAALPLVVGRDDAVEWLADRLEAEFVDDSDVLAIRIRGTEGQTQDLRLLVDAICLAYQDEVINDEYQRRLIVRDATAKSAAKLAHEIETKLKVQKDLLAAGDDIESRIHGIELENLTGIWRELNQKVERYDVNAVSPPRIRHIQPATVRRE
jgi:hypothetical protein